MNAFCIILDGHGYSETVGARCIRTAAEIGGIAVDRFAATPAADAEAMLRYFGLRWTWTTDAIRYCPVTGLRQHPYGGGWARVACALSHYRLWQICAEADDPILVLEHDAVFLRPFLPFPVAVACMINDPAGATRRGDWWSWQMQQRGPGVWPKTWVSDPRHRIPDGLAGNSAYVIAPAAATALLGLVQLAGLWPNDAIMCEQLLPGLQEVYPFVTRVEQTESTTA